MGKGEGGDWNNGLFGCFGNIGNCKFNGEKIKVAFYQKV